MRIWTISDLHFRQEDAMHLLVPFAVPDADLCLIAGDVTERFHLSMHWIGNVIAQKMPVVMVHGNHDYFQASIDHAITRSKFLAKSYDITLLENDVIVIGDVRIVGATLWTDYTLDVGGFYANMPLTERLAKVFHIAPREMADFAEIFRSDERKEGETGFVTIQELIARHTESRRFIDEVLATPFHGKTLVLTHHAPSIRSIHRDFEGDILNGAFASDLTGMIRERKPDVWVHGHVHHFLDYKEAETRIICNARGTGGRPSNFKADFFIDI